MEQRAEGYMSAHIGLSSHVRHSCPFRHFASSSFPKSTASPQAKHISASLPLAFPAASRSKVADSALSTVVRCASSTPFPRDALKRDETNLRLVVSSPVKTR